MTGEWKLYPHEEQLRRKREAAAELFDALVECANDLEAEVNARWGVDSVGYVHPALRSKLERDLSPVTAARALIAKIKGEA